MENLHKNHRIGEFHSKLTDHSYEELEEELDEDIFEEEEEEF